MTMGCGLSWVVIIDVVVQGGLEQVRLLITAGPVGTTGTFCDCCDTVVCRHVPNQTGITERFSKMLNIVASVLYINKYMRTVLWILFSLYYKYTILWMYLWATLINLVKIKLENQAKYYTQDVQMGNSKINLPKKATPCWQQELTCARESWDNSPQCLLWSPFPLSCRDSNRCLTWGKHTVSLSFLFVFLCLSFLLQLEAVKEAHCREPGIQSGFPSHLCTTPNFSCLLLFCFYLFISFFLTEQHWKMFPQSPSARWPGRMNRRSGRVITLCDAGLEFAAETLPGTRR